MALNSLEGELDIKYIKEEKNDILELDHEHRKRSLKLIICCSKQEFEDEKLSLVKEKLQEKIQIETTCLIEAHGIRKAIEKKKRLIHVRVISNDHKY